MYYFNNQDGGVISIKFKLAGYVDRVRYPGGVWRDYGGCVWITSKSILQDPLLIQRDGMDIRLLLVSAS